jgi:hypothetical protein
MAPAPHPPRPGAAPGPDALLLLPDLLTVLDPRNRAAALFRLAGHPDPEVRAYVGRAARWLRAAGEVDPRDVAAIAERLGDAGAELAAALG